MSEQLTLFDAPRKVHPEAKRLNNQCARILERLHVGRVSNAELATLSLKYTSRISDLRKLGYDVKCVEHNHKTGLTFYQLM